MWFETRKNYNDFRVLDVIKLLHGFTKSMRSINSSSGKINDEYGYVGVFLLFNVIFNIFILDSII